MAARTTRLQDLSDIRVAGVRLRPVRRPGGGGRRRWRRPRGVSASGITGSAADAGELLIEEHREQGGGSGRHEELYLVVAGHATFTVDGEEIDAPAGTLVFVHEPGDLRTAVATEDGTLAVVVGGPAGAAGPVSP